METNQSIIDFLISIGNEKILPIFDFLYIGIVITGSSVLFKLFPKWKTLNKNKFRSVFIFATLVSILYVWVDFSMGYLEDPKTKLVLNIFNWFFAVLIYHVFIKTSAKAFEFGWNKFFGSPVKK